MPLFGGESEEFKGQGPKLFMQIFYDGVSAIVRSEFFEDFLEVTVDSPGANAQKVRNLFIRMAFAQQGEDFMFAGGQVVQQVGGAAKGQGSGGLFKVMADTFRDLFPAAGIPRVRNRFEETGGGRAAEKVAGSATGSRLEKLVGVLINREKQGSDFGRDNFQLFQEEVGGIFGQGLAQQEKMNGLPRYFAQGLGGAGEGSKATTSLLLVDTPRESLPDAWVRFGNRDLEFRLALSGSAVAEAARCGRGVNGGVRPGHRVIRPAESDREFARELCIRDAPPLADDALIDSGGALRGSLPQVRPQREVMTCACEFNPD